MGYNRCNGTPSSSRVCVCVHFYLIAKSNLANRRVLTNINYKECLEKYYHCRFRTSKWTNNAQGCYIASCCGNFLFDSQIYAQFYIHRTNNNEKNPYTSNWRFHDTYATVHDLSDSSTVNRLEESFRIFSLISCQRKRRILLNAFENILFIVFYRKFPFLLTDLSFPKK